MSFRDGAPLEDPLPKVTYVIFSVQEDHEGRVVKTPSGVSFTNAVEADQFVAGNAGKEVVPVHTFDTAAQARTFDINKVRLDALAKLKPIEIVALGLKPQDLIQQPPKKPVTRNRGV